MTTMQRLAADKIDPAAHAHVAAFHKDFVDEVAAAVANNHIVVVGMAQNPVVKRAHKVLDKLGAKYVAINHGSYLSGWKRRLAIKLWSGFPTFPQIFVDGVLVGGCSELEKQIEAGTFKG